MARQAGVQTALQVLVRLMILPVVPPKAVSGVPLRVAAWVGALPHPAVVR